MADATATPETDNVETTEESSNEVTIEDAGPARKKLTITVPADVIDEKLEESIGTLMVESAIPGFRKGRVPRQLIERRFGDAVRNETKNQIIAEAYSDAIEKQDLRPVGDPEPDENVEELKLEAGKPLTFSVFVEVVPEFDLPDLESIDIKKPMLEIRDELIDREIANQQQMLGKSESIDGKWEKQDRLVGRATVTKDGEDEPFFTNDEVLVLFPDKEEGGKGQILGLLIDNLHDLLKNTRVGDTINVETVGPEAHEREDIRGVKLAIEFNIRSAERIHPAAVEEIVQHYGLENEDSLREQVKLALESRRDDEQRTAMRDQVWDQLADMVDFELPESLSSNQVTRTLERQRMELLYRGMAPELVEEKLAETRADSEASTRRRLKLQFILARLSREFEVEVSEHEVNGRISQIAAQRGERPAALRAQLAQANRLVEVEMQVREHKTADRVIDKARVTEISAEEWAELQGEGDEKKKPAASKKKTTGKKKTSRKTTRKKAASKS